MALTLSFTCGDDFNFLSRGRGACNARILALPDDGVLVLGVWWR